MVDKIVKLIGLYYYEACDTDDIETCKHNIDKAKYLIDVFGEDLDIDEMVMLQDACMTANQHYAYLMKFESED